MKTKIIYISGNETFEMADIRAAFEEVRATLNLGGTRCCSGCRWTVITHWNIQKI